LSPGQRALVERSLRLLERWGLRPEMAPGIWERRGYLAGDDSQRAAQIRWALEDPSIKAIFCLRGGYGSMRILDLVPLAMLRQQPKILVGSSDVTALILAFHCHSNVVTFHGPNLTDPGLSMGESSPTALSLYRALFVAEPPDPIPVMPILGGLARGRILGGCLSIVTAMVGTPHLPQLEGTILFLEDTNEPIYRIDRMLCQLRLCGHLRGISALSLTLPSTQSSKQDQKGLERILRGLSLSHGVPVVTGLCSGHSRPNLTIPIGIMASLDAQSGELTFLQPPVS
jgi:muramoyltetrapeptide carboxypeptidase